MKIIETIILTNLVPSLLLSYFSPFLLSQEVGDLATKNGPVFLFIASHTLLQRHAEFNRILERDFLTCYCCSCYSSMGIEGNLLILFKNYLKDCKQRVVLNGQTSSKQNTLLVFHKVPF